ncbi:MAG: co-chaperone GroES [Parcubacteria group bacterium]|nr:co-chaperone GroES [Parcubacteria group bacterium]
MKKKTNKITPAKTVGIVPLADRVLIRPMTVQEAEGKKASLNFILPESMTTEKSAQGKVLAVGEGKYVDGKLQPVKVKVGDIVLFSKYSYDEVSSNGEELFLLKEDNILAIIK